MIPVLVGMTFLEVASSIKVLDHSVKQPDWGANKAQKNIKKEE
jgi:hypothetical protein